MLATIAGIFEQRDPITSRAPLTPRAISYRRGEHAVVRMRVTDEYGDSVNLSELASPVFTLTVVSRGNACGLGTVLQLTGTIDTTVLARDEVLFTLSFASTTGVPPGSYAYEVVLVLAGVTRVLVPLAPFQIAPSTTAV